PTTNSASLTIPANTFIAGQEYLAVVVFQAIVDKHPVAGLPGSTNVAYYEIRTAFTIKAQTPIFPLNVTANIGATVSNAGGTMNFRPQDVGSTQSVYVFAVAPSNKVLKSAEVEGAMLGIAAKGAPKDSSVQCVLAQLNSSKQLQAVSAS